MKNSLLFTKLIVVVLLLIALLPLSAFAVSGQTATVLSAATISSSTPTAAICIPKNANKVTAFLKAVNAAGSAPTMTMILQDSNDQTNWNTLVTFTQATTGTSTQFVDVNETTTHPLKCFRGSPTIGGTASPSYTTTLQIYYQIGN